MKREIQKLEQEIAPEETEWDAGKVIAALIVTAQTTGLTFPSSWRPILGRHAKSLLADGFPGDMVTAACYMAVLRGRPGIVQYIAGDLMLAQSGQAMSRAEYEEKLALYGAEHKGSAMLDAHKARVARRQSEIEERRAGG